MLTLFALVFLLTWYNIRKGKSRAGGIRRRMLAYLPAGYGCLASRGLSVALPIGHVGRMTGEPQVFHSFAHRAM
ncbi:MAG: hypothetical protein J6J86_03045 [Lachnospiraceae bacterium]|nr:hypothetical protein [Lachnospiraceae bacterium]